MNKFVMDINSKSGYLLISMKLPKNSSWNEIYDILNNNLDTTLEVSFDYRLSIETKRRFFSQKIKGLMRLLAKKAWKYKRLYD